MVSLETARKMALSFEGAEEQPHFEKNSFRIGKKIFATLDSENKRACFKLSLVHQSVFSAFDKDTIYPIPNKWGKLGWTYFELNKVRKDMLLDAMTLSYCGVAPKKLAEKYKGG